MSSAPATCESAHLTGAPGRRTSGAFRDRGWRRGMTIEKREEVSAQQRVLPPQRSGGMAHPAAVTIVVTVKGRIQRAPWTSPRCTRVRGHEVRRLRHDPRGTSQIRPMADISKPAKRSGRDVMPDYPAALSTCKSASTRARQLRGPHLRTWPWWSMRSSRAATAAVSPSSFPQSSMRTACSASCGTRR